MTHISFPSSLNERVSWLDVAIKANVPLKRLIWLNKMQWKIAICFAAFCASKLGNFISVLWMHFLDEKERNVYKMDEVCKTDPTNSAEVFLNRSLSCSNCQSPSAVSAHYYGFPSKTFCRRRVTGSSVFAYLCARDTCITLSWNSLSTIKTKISMHNFCSAIDYVWL